MEALEGGGLFLMSEVPPCASHLFRISGDNVTLFLMSEVPLYPHQIHLTGFRVHGFGERAMH